MFQSIPKTLPVKTGFIQVRSWLAGLKRAMSGTSDKDLVIGEVLRRNRLITEAQLQTALNVQKDNLYRRGQVVRLGQIVVELGFASEETVVQAINDHYRLSVSSLSDDIKERVANVRGTFIERLPAPHIPIWLQLSITMILFIIMTTVAILIIFNRERDRLYEQTVKIGTVSLRYFADNARIPLLQDDILQLNTLIKKATDEEELLYAVIVDNRGIIRAHTDPGIIGKPFKGADPAIKSTKDGQVSFYNYNLPDGTRVLDLSQQIRFKDKRLGEVHVGVSIDFIRRLIAKERSSVIIIVLIIILLGTLTAVFLGIHLSRPISKLLRATEEISSGNYQYKVHSERKDELGNLTKAFNQMGEELWKNSLLQKSFGKYVGSEVLNMIAADPERVWLKGYRNEATVLFADIRGFTRYSEQKEPEAVVEELNEYFEIATKAIIQFGGYVDKFMGDAVLGVFGVPVYYQDHVERAVRSATLLQHRLRDAGRKGNPLLEKIGIGIDSGIIVSGNIGSQVKMEYTVIGGCVNVASRLNRLAGAGEVIVSHAVQQKLSRIFSLEELPPQQIKGISEPVKTYRVVVQ